MDIDLSKKNLAKGNIFRPKLTNEIDAARAALNDGRGNDFILNITKALLVAPKNHHVLELFSDYLEKVGNLKVAIVACEVSVKFNPDIVQPRLVLATKYMRDGQHERAIQSCQTAVKINNREADAWRALEDIFWILGRFREAFECVSYLALCNGVKETDFLSFVSRYKDKVKASELRFVLNSPQIKQFDSNRIELNRAAASLEDGRANETFTIIDGLGGAFVESKAATLKANMLINCGRLDEALQLLGSVQDKGKHPANLDALGALCYRLLGKPEDARLIYEKVLRVHKKGAEIFLGYAMCLKALGLHSNALNAIDEAINLTGFETGLLCEKASILGRLGKTDEMREALSLAGASWQNDLFLIEGPAVPEPAFEPEISWSGIGKILENGILSRNEKLGILYALGYQADEDGRYEDAISFWHRANAEIRDKIDFDCEAYISSIRKIPENYKKLRLPPLSGEKILPLRPIFIVGMPRSGTSLVEHILAAHPLVKAGGESKIVTEVLSQLIQSFPDRAYPEFLSDMDETDLASIRRRLVSGLTSNNPGFRFITDKLPGNFMHMGLLKHLIPEAIFIDCRREYKDVALSMYSQWFRYGHPYAYKYSEVISVCQAHSKIIDNWIAQLPPKTLYTFQYEALINNPDRTIRKLLRHCHLGFDKSCLQPWKARRAIDNSNARRLEAPISDSRSGRYENYATLG